MTFLKIVKDLSLISTACSFIANVLPNERFLDGYPRTKKAYGVVIKAIATVAFNIRANLPSLAIGFLGFRQAQQFTGNQPAPAETGATGQVFDPNANPNSVTNPKQ
jgi:hypothetical protein